MDDMHNLLINNLSIIFKSEKSVLLGFNDFNIYHSQIFYRNNSEDLISIVCCFDNKFNICLIFTLNKQKKNLGLSILEIEELNPGFPSFIQNKFLKFEIVFNDFINIFASHNNKGLLKFTLKNLLDAKKSLNVLINEFEDYDNINSVSNTLSYTNIFYEANLYNSEKIYAVTSKFLDVLDLNKNKIISNKFEIKKNEKESLFGNYRNNNRENNSFGGNIKKAENSNVNFIDNLADKINKEATDLTEEIKKTIKINKVSLKNDFIGKEKQNIFEFRNNYDFDISNK